MPARPWLEAACAVLLALAASGCVRDAMTPDNAGLRYLALGDSYTIGEGVGADARWPHQLARDVREAGIPLQDPVTIAATGWTTDELSSAIDAAAPANDYDLVSLAIGVNNQYRGGDVGHYRAQFEALLLRAIGFAGGRSERVLVLSIPDWGATGYGRGSGRDLARVARELDAYNAAARAMCERHGVAFVDITPISRTLGDAAGALAEDGLHPSAAQYAQWAALAVPAVRQRLDAGDGLY